MQLREYSRLFGAIAYQSSLQLSRISDWLKNNMWSGNVHAAPDPLRGPVHAPPPLDIVLFASRPTHLIILTHIVPARVRFVADLD